MHARIRDDADRMRAAAERNQPHPVTRPAQVIGRTPALRWRAARPPGRVFAPGIQFQPRIDAEPRRADLMIVALGEPEVLFQQTGTAGSIDQPARMQGFGLAVALAAD